MEQQVQPQITSEQARVRYFAAAGVAAVAALFSLLVLTLLIGNAAPMAKADPNSATNKARKDEMSLYVAQGATEEEKAQRAQEFQQLDEQLNREYWQRMSFAKHGTTLLIIGVLVFLVGAEVARQSRRKIPIPAASGAPNVWVQARTGRYAMAVVSLLIVGGFGVVIAKAPPDYARSYMQELDKIKGTMLPQMGASHAADSGAAGQKETVTVEVQVPGPEVKVPGPKETVTVTKFTDKPYPVPVPKLMASALESMPKNWPGFRGWRGTGVAPTATPPAWDGKQGTNILWKAPIPMKGLCSPIYWEGRVYLSGATTETQGDQTVVRSQVYCYDAADGKLLWQTEVPDVPRTADDGELSDYADTGMAAPTMTTNGLQVFALFGNGVLAALAMADDAAAGLKAGTLQWTCALGNPDSTYGFASSPVFWRDRIFVQCDEGRKGPRLYAINPVDGKPFWMTPRGDQSPTWTSPIVIDTGIRQELILAGNPHVIAYDPESGKELWRADCLGGDMACSPVYAGGLVLVANDRAKAAAIRPGGTGNVTDTRIAWSNEEWSLPDTCSPVTDGDLLYFLSSGGTLTCVDVHSGEKVWEQELGTGAFASPTVVGDRLFITDREGVTHVIACAREYKELATYPLGEAVDASLAFVGNRVFIRGEKNLYCIGAKP